MQEISNCKSISAIDSLLFKLVVSKMMFVTVYDSLDIILQKSGQKTEIKEIFFGSWCRIINSTATSR
jgi:hypothetical protein